MGFTLHLLCIPSFQRNTKSVKESTSRSSNSTTGFPILVDTNVVHNTHEHVGFQHSGATGGPTHLPPVQAGLPTSHDLQGEALFRYCIRQSFQANNISQELAQFVIDSKPRTHQANIGSQLSKWNQFCLARQIDPRELTAEQMGVYITFLSKQLSSGKIIANYFSGMRKFLSDTALAKSYNVPIKQLLVTAIHAKPALPKLPGEVWNADRVLAYFLRSPPNAYLTKLQLAGKCVVLLMLASGRRKGDLMGLDVRSQFMKKTDNVFYFTLSKLSKGNSPFIPQNKFMQYLEFHKFPATSQICPYTIIEDYLEIIRHPNGKPSHTHFFVTTTDPRKPAHSETVRRWAVDTLKLAGITCTPHSIRSAHASMAVVHHEPIDSIMERCGWRKSSAFYKHYLRPVASGEKPTTPQGVTIDTTTFFCPPKLLKPGSKVIPPPPEYMLQADIFPCGTSNPTDFQHRPSSPMQISLENYKRKTATDVELVEIELQKSDEHFQEEIDITQALLSPRNTISDSDVPASQPTQQQQDVTSELKKFGPNCKAKPKKSPYLVITSTENPQLTTTVVLNSSNSNNNFSSKTIPSTTKDPPISSTKPRPSVELKMSPQYLTLRSRKLVRRSFSKKAYPRKRELRPLLPKPPTSPPSYTEVNRDNTWIGPASQPISNGTSIVEQVDTTDKELLNEKLPDIQPHNTQTTQSRTAPAPVQKHKQPTVELIQGYQYKKKISANNGTPSIIRNRPAVPISLPIENSAVTTAPQPTEMTDFTQFVGPDIMAVGHSKINCLFPDIALDKVVLFGKNFNFTYPVSPGFHPSALCTHFICLGVFPLKLGIIVPTDFPDIGPEECMAITINDIPFKTKVFNIEEIRDTLYANFKK